MTNFDDMLKRNPLADRDSDILIEALNAIKDLRQIGIQPTGYRLASPFERNRKCEHHRKVMFKK
jgi:hypothetical protein